MSVLNETSEGPKDMVGKAYRAYITDPRLDTDEDEEAFGEALYEHVINVFEDLLDDNLTDIEYAAQDIVRKQYEIRSEVRKAIFG